MGSFISPERERERIRMIDSFRQLPLMKGCRWMTYHLTVKTERALHIHWQNVFVVRQIPLQSVKGQTDLKGSTKYLFMTPLEIVKAYVFSSVDGLGWEGVVLMRQEALNGVQGQNASKIYNTFEVFGVGWDGGDWFHWIKGFQMCDSGMVVGGKE